RHTVDVPGTPARTLRAPLALVFACALSCAALAAAGCGGGSSASAGGVRRASATAPTSSSTGPAASSTATTDPPPASKAPVSKAVAKKRALVAHVDAVSDRVLAEGKVHIAQGAPSDAEVKREIEAAKK